MKFGAVRGMWTRLRFGAGAVTIFQCGGNIRGPCTIGGACASSLSSEPLHLLSITSLATTISCQPEHCDYLEYNFKPLARLQQNRFPHSATPPIWKSQPRPPSPTSTPRTHYSRRQHDGTAFSRPSKTRTASPQTSSAEVPEE